MANFDEILAGLHANAVLSDSEDKTIIITQERTFSVPSGYNTTLGYVGDVNSQIVTFTLPKYHEGHDLSQCAKKKLLWKNLSSGTEGTENLIIKESLEDETWTAAWEVKPEVMTQAGAIEIAISIYDIIDDKLAFSWNTATFNGFKIAESFTHIGTDLDTIKLPAKDEILNIEVATRNIVAPKGYNFTFCNYGDIGISTIYLSADRKIHGMDLLSDTIEIFINLSIGDTHTEEIKIEKSKIVPMFENEEKVLIYWEVLDNITSNDFSYTGPINISIKILIKNNGIITKRWTTSTFSKLTIGPSSLLTDLNNIDARDEELIKKAVEELIGEVEEELIEDYFNSREFIIEA